MHNAFKNSFKIKRIFEKQIVLKAGHAIVLALLELVD